jgi:3-hydroxyisobutyrate dehydrogenase-like beta-hydroxyacid dehydrogenase
MSSISIIGLGNMASALADRALAGGNTVEIIGRDPAKANELACRPASRCSATSRMWSACKPWELRMNGE